MASFCGVLGSASRLFWVSNVITFVLLQQLRWKRACGLTEGLSFVEHYNPSGPFCHLPLHKGSIFLLSDLGIEDVQISTQDLPFEKAIC